MLFVRSSADERFNSNLCLIAHFSVNSLNQKLYVVKYTVLVPLNLMLDS